MPFTIQEIDSEHTNLISDGRIVVQQVSHAHDAMEFFVIRDLPSDSGLYLQFAKDLFAVVTEEFGGKTSVEIADSIKDEKREKLHHALKEAGFINVKLNSNVVAITRESLEKNIVIISEKSGVKNYFNEFNKGTYQIVTDRQELLKRTDEFLLLLEKSGYLPVNKVREGLYSELGMQRRILHSDAMPVAIIHKDKIIGCAFLFCYADNTRIYVHDLTLAEEFRHQKAGGQLEHFGQAFFVKFHELASRQYPHVQRLWLIGGGDAGAAKLREHIYKDILGGESIVDLENDSNVGMYVNFKPPGPRLFQAGQREDKQIEIVYSDGFSVKLFSAKPGTLTENDRARIKRLEQQELQAREVQRFQKQEEKEKSKLSTSLQALTHSPKLGVNSPSGNKQLKEEQQEKLLIPETTTTLTRP